MALAANALTTTAACDTANGLSITTAWEIYINAASDVIARYCNRTFQRSTGIVENVKGYGGNILTVARTPLESITSIVIDGTTIDSSEYSIESAGAGQIYSDTEWEWTAKSVNAAAPFVLPGSERSAYVITYTGGYSLPQNNRTPGTGLPYDLELVCMDLATLMYKTRNRDASLSQEQVGNASVSYALSVVDGATLLSKRMMQMLAPYKRVL